jgi:acyl-CoA synthetase (AMP-forming)/AMP-acid ligase II
MGAWNYATIWETAAEQLPDHPAQVQGERRITWAQLDRRADGVARTLLDAGARQQDKVAQYLHNAPEYIESMFAAFKAGLVPVNTNYRYADDELLYLWDNSDAVAVVFHGVFTERIERIRARLPRVRLWLWVDDGSGPCPDWALAYETAAAAATDRVMAPWGRGDDDLLLMYTGGTTGMPKGVMWRQDSLIRALGPVTGAHFTAPEVDYTPVREAMSTPGTPTLPGSPLMHATAQFICLLTMNQGGTVVLLEHRHFDVVELLDTVEREKVSTLIIVGDAFARPMAATLDDHPGRWDLSSLAIVTSSGVMWSQETKDALLKHHPGVLLYDSLGSSEAVGLGASVSAAGATAGTARFTLGPNARVVGDDGKDVLPGSGDMGRVALKGHTPVGYYKDPIKSAETFVQIDGDTYSMPGDYAIVELDGTLTLLGRGSVCINTGGEKVFPEEVEEVLKLHPAVVDAVVVGLPDMTFGEAVTAVVETRNGDHVDGADLIAHVKGKLASFKAPKSVVRVDTIGRAPNGKVDYKRMKAYAGEQLGVALPG